MLKLACREFITLLYLSYTCLFALLTFSSCADNNGENSIETIYVDVNNMRVVHVDSIHILQLDYTDEALLYDIVDVINYRDTIYVYSRNFLKRFENKTGHYLGLLAESGNGEGQYSSIGRFWLSGDTFKIFDNNNGRINCYSPSGRFLGSERQFERMPEFLGARLRPNTFFESPDSNGVYILNNYVGSVSRPTPMYTYYPDSHSSRILEGRTLKSGAYLIDRGFTDFEHNRLLLWEGLRDTLFTIRNERVEPLYVFDFGDYAFPKGKQQLNELSDRINAFMSAEDQVYISLLRYFQSKGDFIYFSFTSNDGEIGYVRLDEVSRTCTIVSLVDGTRRYKPAGFIKIERDSAMVSLTDVAHPECNPALYKFSLNVFE